MTGNETLGKMVTMTDDERRLIGEQLAAVRAALERIEQEADRGCRPATVRVQVGAALGELRVASAFVSVE